MGLLRRKRTAAAPEAVDATIVAIAQAPARQRVRVAGQVMRIRTRPISGNPSLAITFSDDSGSAIAVWTGRRSIGGITLGRKLVIEGVGRQVGDRLEFTNPEYELRP